MKKLLFILFALYLVGCKKTITERVNEEDIKSFLASELKKDDSGTVIEKLQLIKIDTIPLKEQYMHLLNIMFDKYELNSEEIVNLTDKAKSNLQLIKLSNGLLDYGYGTLNENYREDLKDDLKDLKSLQKEDSLLNVDITNLENIIKKADSIHPNYYRARYFVVTKLSNKSTNKDTIGVILDKDLHIVNYDEYGQNIKKIYKPVSSFYEDWK